MPAFCSAPGSARSRVRPPMANGRPTAAISVTRGMRRSIGSTPANFSNLEVAWRFKTDNLGPRPEINFESTPLMVNGVVYSTAGTRRAVVALDAATGELLWVHSEREGRARCGGAAAALGPRPRLLDRRHARNASSTSRQAIGSSRSTRRPDSRCAGFGKRRRRRSEDRVRSGASISSPRRSACTPRRSSPRTW